jgi:toxin FitB
MNYLLDTNVISELISKRSNKKVVEWLDRLDSNTIYLSVITIGDTERYREAPAFETKRKDQRMARR